MKDREVVNMKNKKDIFDDYQCDGQLSFRTITMEIKEDKEWEKKIGKERNKNGCYEDFKSDDKAGK